MKIKINNSEKEVTAGCSVNEAVQAIIDQNTGGIAIALNDNVVPRSEWTSVKLNPNDKILIIKAAQGG